MAHLPRGMEALLDAPANILAPIGGLAEDILNGRRPVFVLAITDTGPDSETFAMYLGIEGINLPQALHALDDAAKRLVKVAHGGEKCPDGLVS